METDSDFLTKIIADKKSLLKTKEAFFLSLKKKFAQERVSRYSLFKKAISKPGKVNLIAEIKRASPSQGILAADFDVLKLARVYVENRADALSILTEENYFLGKPVYIKKVSEKFDVPILTKDFIIDEVQIYEAFVNGASAVLLIVGILDDPQLVHLFDVASRLDLDCLVEVHDEKELERALRLNAEIIGINNRDLHTFKVDLKVSERLMVLIPKNKVIVVESGLKSFEEIKHFQSLGAHAVLIGETFIKATNIGKKIKEVMYGPSHQG